jgi:hypothetical protein
MDNLRNCQESNNYHDVLSFWHELLIQVYGNITPVPTPYSWLDLFIPMVDTTDNSGGFVAAFRHAGLFDPESLVYYSENQLRTDYVSWCSQYYDNVKLPHGNEGNFKEDVYTKAVRVLVDKWNQMYDAVCHDSLPGDIALNWNLDTGRVQDETNELTFWRV